MGDSHIRIGDDSAPLSNSNVMIVNSVVDGGFFEATSLLPGRYLTIRRDTSSPKGNIYNIFQLKAY